MSVVDTRLIVGVSEIAELFGVGRTTVTQWVARREASGFPLPVARILAGSLWNVHDVLRWYEQYVPRKGAKPGRAPGADKVAEFTFTDN